MAAALALLDGLLGRIVRAARWLALPVALLLFAQWPLRDLVRAYSREANDLGQWLFALYVAVAIVAATRAGLHLRADFVARRYPPRVRRALDRAVAGLAFAPWAIFVLVSAWPAIAASVRGLERFPDTADPGYFLVKVAGGLLALLVLLQSALDLLRRDGAP